MKKDVNVMENITNYQPVEIKENLKKIMLLDTSVSSNNRGDDIIMDACNKQLNNIIRRNFSVHVPTHSPIHILSYQIKSVLRKRKMIFHDYDLKFLCGTNSISGNMAYFGRNWKLNLFSPDFLMGTVCVGVGTDRIVKTNKYTSKLYRKYLSNSYIHSTRDEATASYLKSIGLNAINTGCVTLWGITKDFCDTIPSEKSNNVIFTLTDYNRNVVTDKKFISLLKANYQNIFFWPQGSNDYLYIKELDNLSDITVLAPNLRAYDNFLENVTCDYIGTRLHGGIRAIQHGKRSIILSVDNRAENMAGSYGLTIIKRENIEEIEMKLKSDFKSNISANTENVKIFLDQFNNFH